ncbi:MAG TPA: 3-hydroxyacyl-CoA dehydrogenase family protein [Gemmatimonadaceae bacterium]|nr:3-hydroxyacyl-CoA dehydrogenase family protein [Gemmatimonadaceae bacterium]
MTNVAIIGAGTMGHGIGYVTAIAGYTVTLTDVDEDVLERARAHIGLALDSGVMRGKVSEETRREAMDRIFLSTNLEGAIGDAQVVIESAPEKLALKQDLFRRICVAAPRHALLATNTSSLSVSEIAHATDCPERVVGMHFFNPVAAMKLVEVIRGAETSEDSTAKAHAFAESLGKKAIVVRDTPGFATSRLGIVLGLEAMRMLEQGVASAADIDTAMELGYNHPVGPLRLTDIVGLDVRLAVADHLHASLGGDAFAAPAILREMVAAGRLGKKSGRGFYNWLTPQ